jgi:hypothetical protein
VLVEEKKAGHKGPPSIPALSFEFQQLNFSSADQFLGRISGQREKTTCTATWVFGLLIYRRAVGRWLALDC